MSKQKTLFQSWGNQKQKLVSEKPPSEDTYTLNDIVDLCDSFEDGDDDLLCEAEFSTNGLSVQHDNENPTNISIGADGFAPTQGESQNTSCPGFDMSAGKLWIYPTNYPVREYQFNIVNQSLFKNTMVTLPTGLGKTFIAAVVMYNFYRWYPQGKVIFMAPTKPLVAQQIEACYNIMGIPQDHTAEMTGSMGPPKREKAWNEKRVFFLTPQVLTNDLSRGSCPAHFVKCLVIDEAHKALGNHAYCQVVRELIKYTEQFRVLALSATPGSDIKAVQQVLSNLLISHIEIRTEDSIDIKQYSHERVVDKVVVPLGDELTKVKAKYIHIMDMVVTKLKRHGVLYNRDTTSLSKFLILKARDAFRQNPPERLQRSQYGIVEGDFALAMSLYHGYELLQLHGSRSLYNFLEGILTGDKGYGRTRTELSRNGDFNELIDMLRQKYSVPQDETPSQAQSRPFVIGHPKMEKLQEIVLEHFKKFEASNATTRVMIFSQYRDSVQEITDMLNLHRPLVKVMSFIGQSSAGKSTKGFTQKEQLKVMKEFREGGYNTLVSTCVGEEGLDIGDVDLIICFDAHKSPIRLVQRMGRTGRKREGRIVMLVTQGKEEQIYNQSQYSKRSIHRAILNGAKSLHFYQHSVRMVPDGVNPVVHKMHITVNENFKPTKKLNTDLKPEKTAKITNLFSKDKQDVSDGLITREEYEELKPWLVPEENIPKLHRFDLGCLSKDQESTEEPVVPQGCFLSLSEWSPWQTTLQETSDLIDHSMQAKHYVELMEFIQLQSNLDKDADPYGLEMAAYLNEEDIHTGGKEKSSDSIAKFCVSTTCEDGSRYAPRTGESKAKDPKSRKRHSDMLPTFDLEVNELDEESEDELPPVPCFTHHRSPNRNDDEVLKNKESSHCVPDSNNFCEIASDIMFKDGEKCYVEDSGFDQSNITVAKKRDPSSKSKNRKSDIVINSKAKALDQKMKRNMKTGKRKKVSGFNRSVIELLKVTDENDFDSTPPDKSTNTVTLNDPVDLTSDDCVVKRDSSVKCNEDFVSPNRKNYQRQYVIRTPPTVEDAIRHCEAADLEADRVKIDLLELIDEWHRENENGKYLVLLTKQDSRNLYATMNSSKKVQKMSESISDICINPVAIPKSSVQCKDGDQINSLEEIKDITSKYNTPKTGSVSTRACINDHEAEVKNEVSVVKKKSKIDSNNLLSAIDTNQDVKLSGSFTPLIPDYVENIVDQKDKGIDSMTNSEKFSDQRYQVAKSTKMFDSDIEKSIDLSHNLNVAPGIRDQNKKITNGVSVERKSLVTKGGKSKKLQKGSDNLESGVKASTKNKNSARLHDKVDIVMSEWGIEDSDDDLFGNFTTPDISCTKEASSPRFSRDSSTQFTFTQALNCLHSESIASESGSSRDMDGHKECSKDKQVVGMKIDSDRQSTSTDCTMLKDQTCASKKTGNEFTNNDLYENLDSRSQPPFTSNSSKKQIPDMCTKNNLRRPSTSSDEGEQPQFDLGFDIDEDIIPPSPNTSQPFQCTGKNRLSQTFTSRLSQSRLTSNLPCDESKSDQNMATDTTNIDMRHDLKSKRSLRLDDNCFTGLRLEPLEEEKESQSLLDDDRSKYVRDKIYFNSIADLTRKDKPVIQRPSESEENFSEIGTCISENIVNFKGGGTLDKTEEVTAMENDFESSFALVDDDFDEWFVSDAEKLNVDVNKNSDAKNTSFDKLTTQAVNTEKTVHGNQTCISITNRGKPHTNLDQNTKKKKHLMSHSRKSVFCPSDLSFEDSFSFHDNCGDRNVIDNISNSVKPRKLENTSTPVAKNGTVKVNLSSPVVTPVECKKLKEPLNYSGTANIEEEVLDDADMDDSFVIRKKKKKPAQLESPVSQMNVQSAGNMKETNKQFVAKYNEKTVNADMNWSEDDDFDDRLLMKKNNYFSKTNNIVHINSDSEEDFEKVPGMHDKSDDKTNIGHKEKLSNSRSKNHVELKRKSKSKRPSNPFLEEEAEISEDEDDKATSDETDASDLDQYDNSFIHDSQFSQSQGLDQTDIQALYLKSVKSPVNDRVGFKLQYNHKNVDVYSQVPKEDESQYMEDSFCVGSEEDDWLAQDDYHGEITVCHNQSAVLQSGKKRRKGVSNLQTGRQRAIHFGRMKALNEIKSKLAKKNKCNVFKKDKCVQSKQGTEDYQQKLPRTTRIQILEESSSDEDMNVTSHGGGNIMSPTLQITKKRKRVRLLSSSDEEIQKPKLVCSQQSQHTGKKPWNLSLNQNIERNNKSTSEIELGSDVFDNNPSSNQFGNKQHSPGNKTREERIQKQKVLQEEFKRKMTEASIKKLGSADQCINKESLNMTKIKDISSKEGFNLKEITDFDDTSLLLNQNPKTSNSACILVDSKEISGAQDIISNLRFKHKIRVSAAQLPGCDYIVSNRMAVERKQWSDFSNGANRTKLIERIQHLRDLYDRPCLIIEKDRVKSDDAKSEKPAHWTKYIERTCAMLLKSNIKLLFTDTQTETASVLAELCLLEKRKDMDITVPVDLGPLKTDMVKFYASFPKLSYVHALNLCDGFKSVSQFLKSPVAEIERKGKMSTTRATEVFNHIRRNFDVAMLPTKHK